MVFVGIGLPLLLLHSAHSIRFICRQQDGPPASSFAFSPRSLRSVATCFVVGGTLTLAVGLNLYICSAPLCTDYKEAFHASLYHSHHIGRNYRPLCARSFVYMRVGESAFSPPFALGARRP